MESKFIEASKKERFAFKQFIDKYNLFKDDYNIYLTPEYGYDKYDALVQKYHPKSYSIEKRYIIEFKIRNVSDITLLDCREKGWILEKRKFNDLKKIQNIDPEKNQILYISFINDKTLVWNLTELEKKGLLEEEKKIMNKHTMRSRKDKVNKSVYLLKEEWAKQYYYVYDDDSYYRHQKEDDKLKRIRKEDTKSTYLTINKILGLDKKN